MSGEDEPFDEEDTEAGGEPAEPTRSRSDRAQPGRTRKGAMKGKAVPGAASKIGPPAGLGKGALPVIHIIELSEEEEEEVGYRKPPKQHQFPHGQSGNPRGRPVGAKTRRLPQKGRYLEDVLRGEMDRMVKYIENGVERQMPVIQAVIRAQVIEALQGTTEAAKLLLRMVQAFDLQECRHFERFAKSLIDQKLKGEERIRRMGADPSPDQLATIPLPHPDHIDVDPMTGSVAIKGPLDEAERLAQQKIYEARELDRLTLAEFDAWLGKKMPRKDRAALQKSRKELLERIALLTTELGEDDEDAV